MQEEAASRLQRVQLGACRTHTHTHTYTLANSVMNASCHSILNTNLLPFNPCRKKPPPDFSGFSWERVNEEVSSAAPVFHRLLAKVSGACVFCSICLCDSVCACVCRISRLANGLRLFLCLRYLCMLLRCPVL